MKYLLDNRLAPLTFSWGFIDAPLEPVKDAYRRWQRLILHRVKIAPIDLPLAEALRQLEPLDNGSQRVLFLTTRSGWTACFDNGVRGGNPWTFVGELCERLRCRGVACRSIPDTIAPRAGEARGTWGAVKFTMFAPGARKLLNIERTVAATHDVGGWEFDASGAVQPFEQVERYAARRIADRFTPEMLGEYCRALGIDAVQEDFYGGRGYITYSVPWLLRRLPPVSLADARSQLGLSE